MAVSDDEILDVLKKILRVLALQVSSGTSVTEGARALKMAGLDNQMIADVLNTSPATIRVVTSNLRLTRGSGRRRLGRRSESMAEQDDRVERLLALLLIQQLKTQREKAIALNVAGFTNTEVADILQTKATVVASVLIRIAKGQEEHDEEEGHDEKEGTPSEQWQKLRPISELSRLT